MIVKVQVPLMSNIAKPMALVYDEEQKFRCFVDVSAELLKTMDGRPKAYFIASIDDDGMLILGDEVEARPW